MILLIFSNSKCPRPYASSSYSSYSLTFNRSPCPFLLILHLILPPLSITPTPNPFISLLFLPLSPPLPLPILSLLKYFLIFSRLCSRYFLSCRSDWHSSSLPFINFSIFPSFYILASSYFFYCPFLTYSSFPITLFVPLTPLFSNLFSHEVPPIPLSFSSFCALLLSY